ncbi:hypothetical protein [Kribbella italica]|uniref:Spy/CpxP family protein refolding chaperone n=1 Tax=Kribbella italica TaxID=1540520 RepID=A0A7W9JEQ4_9ACTN|nr:hypothetical protein [Kribbella italica]MBB5840432.1 Spy/CpxP family protein refolding chaperone [Kribbella italica]
MNRILAAGVSTLALGGALLATAAPASAAPAAAAQQTVASAPATTQGYEYYTWYWARDTCESEGAKLQVRGVISNYYCQQSAYTTWYLYVLYR